MFIPLIAQYKNARNAKTPLKVTPTNGNQSMAYRRIFQTTIKLIAPVIRLLK